MSELSATANGGALRRNPPAEPLIKVTLESLKGISLKTTRQRPSDDQQQFVDMSDLCKGDVHKKPGHPRIPHVTAAVSFSGSAADMQVGSSSLCPRTGKLLVESEPACLVPVNVPGDASSSSDDETFPLVAQWDKGEEAQGSSRRTSSKKPHLTVRLPSQDPKLPSVSLEQMNRDCNVVRNTHHQAPELESSDLSSESGGEELDRNTSQDDASVARGPSVIWSASGSGMPEIIELNVSLNVGNDESLAVSAEGEETEASSPTTPAAPQEGIAYLVFFGHADKVTTTMDLPVKRPQKPLHVAESEAQVTLNEEAMLRIRVDVLPDGKEDQPNNDAVYSKSLLDTFGRKRLEPILQQLRHESDQQQRVEERKDEAPAIKAAREAEEPRVSFCAGDRSFLTILKELTDAVKYCDDGGVYVHSGDSVASTLDTAASLGI